MDRIKITIKDGPESWVSFFKNKLGKKTINDYINEQYEINIDDWKYGYSFIDVIDELLDFSLNNCHIKFEIDVINDEDESSSYELHYGAIYTIDYLNDVKYLSHVMCMDCNEILDVEDKEFRKIAGAGYSCDDCDSTYC